MRSARYIFLASLAFAASATLSLPARADTPVPWWAGWFQTTPPARPLVAPPARRAARTVQAIPVAARQPQSCQSVLCGKYIIVGF